MVYYSKCLVPFNDSIGNPTLAVRIRDSDSLYSKTVTTLRHYDFGFNYPMLVHLASALQKSGNQGPLTILPLTPFARVWVPLLVVSFAFCSNRFNIVFTFHSFRLPFYSVFVYPWGPRKSITIQQAT